MRNQLVAKSEVCGEHGFNAEVSKPRTRLKRHLRVCCSDWDLKSFGKSRIGHSLVVETCQFTALLTGYGKSFVLRVVAVSVRWRQKSRSMFRH